MKLKLILCSLFVILVCLGVSAQITTVTGTISSPDGFLLVGGSITANFTPINGQINCAQSLISGQRMGTANNPCTVTATMDNTGTFTMNLTDDHRINPQGGQWSFSVCPPINSPCQTVLVDIFGATQDISNSINNALTPMTGSALNLPQFFADSEIPNSGPNMVYYNVTSNVIRYYNGISWGNISSGSLPNNFYQGGTFNFNQLSNGINTIFGKRATDTSCTGPWIDFRNAANTLDLFLVDCNGVVQVPEIYISGPNPEIAIPLLNNGTGTTSALLAKLNGTAVQKIGTGDTAIPVYPVIPSNTVNGNVVCAPGTTGNACVVLLGQATCTFDAGGGTANHYVGASTTTAGDCKDLGATLPAGPICIVGQLMTSPAGGANGTVFVQPFCYHT